MPLVSLKKEKQKTNQFYMRGNAALHKAKMLIFDLFLQKTCKNEAFHQQCKIMKARFPISNINVS